MRDRVLWLGCLVYAALLSWLGAVKYAAHRNLIDFGIFAQTVSSAFGCFCNPIEGSHWAFHFSPVLYGVAAIVALAREPYTLIVLQAIAGALTAPPVYAIVRRRTDPGTARLAALVVWFYPPLAGLIFGDFHENGFAPAAVAWLIYCFEAGSLGWAAAFAALTLCIKEDQAIFLLVAGALGIWVYRNEGDRRTFCAIVVAVSAGVLAVFFGVIQPHANASPLWHPTRFYAWTPADLQALPFGLLARAGFLLLILAPLAFLPLRSRWFVLALAPLAEVLLSRMPTTFTLGSHYAGAWIGYVLVAFAFGVRPSRMPRALWAAVALCVVEFLVANPLHPGLNLRPRAARDVQLDALLDQVPGGASVATQEEAYTHLALFDPDARLLPEDATRITDACLVVVDRDFPDSPRLQEYGPTLRVLIARRLYVPVLVSGGAVLFHRTIGCR